MAIPRAVICSPPKKYNKLHELHHVVKQLFRLMCVIAWPLAFGPMVVLRMQILHLGAEITVM